MRTAFFCVNLQDWEGEAAQRFGFFVTIRLDSREMDADKVAITILSAYTGAKGAEAANDR